MIEAFIGGVDLVLKLTKTKKLSWGGERKKFTYLSSFRLSSVFNSGVGWGSSGGGC